MEKVEKLEQALKTPVSKLKSPRGKAYIVAGFNNTIITLTDSENQVVCWKSSGAVGFKGSKKSTPYASATAAEAAARKAVEKGLKEVSVYVKGPGNGRINAIKSLRSGGLNVTSIADVTPIPHNGCRAKNRRRV